MSPKAQALWYSLALLCFLVAVLHAFVLRRYDNRPTAWYYNDRVVTGLVALGLLLAFVPPWWTAIKAA